MIYGPKKLVMAAVFYWGELRLPSCEIHIKKKKIKKHGGYCTSLGPNSFEIVIDKNMSRVERFTVLAHEMIHVQQYLEGRLFDFVINGEPRTLWNRNKVFDESKVKWEDRPWEIEAMAEEDALYERWVAHELYRRTNKIYN